VNIEDARLPTALVEVFRLAPRGIISGLDLLRPIYKKTAAYGHFGRNDPDFTWEKTDKAAILKKEAKGLKKITRGNSLTCPIPS